MNDKPKKKRISTLAKAYDVSSDVLLRLLKDAGFEVKSASSMISSDTFAKIKPDLLKEKEIIERKKMAKAGIKIPLKIVLKKSVKQEKKPKPGVAAVGAVKLKKAPVIDKPKSTEEVPLQEDSVSPKAGDSQITDVPKEVQAPPKQEIIKKSSKSEEIKKSVKAAKKPDSIESPEAPPEKKKPEEKPAKPVVEKVVQVPDLDQELKVTVEKPDEKLAARIQKYLIEKRTQKKTERGYSGKFGKLPGIQKKRQKEKDGEKPKDVFAVRAQQAGVMIPTGENRTDHRKETPYQKKKTGKVKGKRKKTKEQIEQELSMLRSNVNKVMAKVGRGTPKVKYRKDKAEDIKQDEKKTLKVAEFITIAELAGLMDVTPNQVIAKCMALGIMVTINQRLDHETIAIIADEFDYEAVLMDEYNIEEMEELEEENDEKDLVLRAPVVTIMGHVDHGKTSILDFVRKSNVASGETGGITQHIGAYLVETPAGQVCFLDTPGHEAFASMRSRGAQITDVVVLVVAADSMVMPQTKESIQHARNAKVSIVVAINKCDLPNANPDKIRAQLAEEGLKLEGWGGDIQNVEVSAKTGAGIEKLLEVLALEAEILELKANPNRQAKGIVIETRLDKGKGAMATVLVQDGSLHIGDAFVCGSHSGRVRSLLNEMGKRLSSAGPSCPVQVLGLEGLPQAGDSFLVMANEKEAREVATRRKEAAKDRELRQKHHITLEQLHEQIESGKFHELKLIIKGDVDGSIEAIASSLERLSTPEVKINIISSGVGAVKEADIHLASSSQAIIVAFHVLPSESVRQLAEEEGVMIKYHRVIYDVVSDIKDAMEGMLTPEIVEEVTGEAKILKLFKVPKVGTIAGCLVNSGAVDRDSRVHVYREGIEISTAKVSSLKRLKDDVRSVKAGLECGIGIEGVKDIQEGDILGFFKKVKVAKKLTAT